MTDYDTVAETIRTEITGDLSDIRGEFLEHFGEESERFIALMSSAFIRWRELDAMVGEGEKKATVSGLVYSAITQHIVSLRLFLSGYIVAAGNIERQVLETIALSLLCSCKELDVL